jgi:hypothetical protein
LAEPLFLQKAKTTGAPAVGTISDLIPIPLNFPANQLAQSLIVCARAGSAETVAKRRKSKYSSFALFRRAIVIFCTSPAL